MTRALLHDDSGAMDSATENFVRYRRHGDLAALGLVFDALAPRLLALALHLCGNAADAEDALQATFVVAMRKAVTFDASQPVGPWLAGVLAGEARNLTRRERRRRGEGFAEARGVAASVDPATAAEQSELVARLRTHIEALPIEQRQVLLLQLQYGLQPAEIAEVVGVPPGTVRMRLHRGLQALRALLPAGFIVGSVLALLPSRGLAQVRTAVLREATVVTTGLGVVAAVGMGGLLMKKLLLGVAACLVLLLGGWWGLQPDDGNATGATRLPEHARLAVASGSAPPTSIGAAAPAAAMERTPAMPGLGTGVGSARIVVRGDVMQRDGRDWVATSSHGSGEPVPHAPIELRPKDAAGGSRRVLTTPAGEVVVADLPVGQWVARTMFLMEVPVQMDFRVTEGAEVAVELHMGMKAAHGRVVDARGMPVAGAEVWVGRDGMLGVLTGVHLSQLAPVRLAVTSGADGTFRCLHLGNEWFVGARKAGFASSWAHPNLEGVTTLTLADRPASIVVHVQFDSNALQDQFLVVAEGDRVMRRSANGDSVRSPLATIGREVSPGHFLLDGLVAGAHTVSLFGQGHRADAKVSLRPGQQSEVTMRVRDSLAVRGRVVGEDGSPKVGVLVAAVVDGAPGTRTSRTQEDGTFELLAQTRVPFTLTASRPNTLAKVEHRVVPPARGDVQCDLVLVEAPPLRGQLRSTAGVGVADRWIRAVGENDATPQFVLCDGEGKFVCWGLQGVFATLSAHRSVEAPAIAGTELRVEIGDAFVRLTLPADALPTAAVKGRVVDAVGMAIAYPSVHVDGRIEGPPAPPQSNDNSFAIGELAAGPHVVRIAGAGCLPLVRAIELTAGQQLDLGEVVLARSAILRVRLLRPDGSPWHERAPQPKVTPVGPRSSSDAELSIDCEAAADGAVVITGMPAGRYRVHGPDGDELLVDPVEVDLRTEAVTEVTLRTAVGRRRELRFAPPTAATHPRPSVAQVRRDDGVVILQREWNAVAGAADPIDCVLPIGDYVVEARAGSVVTHRARFRVGPELGGEAVVEVALLR